MAFLAAAEDEEAASPAAAVEARKLRRFILNECTTGGKTKGKRQKDGSDRGGDGSGPQSAEAPLAPAKLGHGVFQVLPVEVRPQLRCEVQLRVGGLPKQKVAQALLAAGADQQVDLRDGRGGVV